MQRKIDQILGEITIIQYVENIILKKFLNETCIYLFLDERFEYARKLKNTILKLRVAGEKLGKYELEKRHAIEMEDYEKARQKKNQVDQFRTDIYQDLSIEQLLEREGVGVFSNVFQIKYCFNFYNFFNGIKQI